MKIAIDINLPEEQAAIIREAAARRGLTDEEWVVHVLQGGSGFIISSEEVSTVTVEDARSRYEAWVTVPQLIGAFATEDAARQEIGDRPGFVRRQVQP